MSFNFSIPRRIAAAIAAVLSLVGGSIVIVLVDHSDPSNQHTLTVQLGAGTPAETITASTPTAAAVKAASTANAIANSAPTSCSPDPGTGELGTCAPTRAMEAASRLTTKLSFSFRAVASAASTTSTIGGHPIGVDVSSYQGCSIDWSKQNVAFAFFKATEGTRYTDPCLKHNVASAKAAHLPYGVYDFLRPGRSSAIAEADHFIAAVRAAGANTSLPPVADVEANSGLSRAALSDYVCAWHARVASQLHRAVTITYTGNWFWTPSTAQRSCGTLLWVSAYTYKPIIPQPWKAYTFWQYSDGVYGPTPRINRWDTDVFAGTLAELHALAGSKPAPTSKWATSHFNLKVLLSGERHAAEQLLTERRSAQRHNGWAKLGSAHLQTAIAAKHALRRANLRLHAAARRSGWKRLHRAERHAVIHQLL